MPSEDHDDTVARQEFEELKRKFGVEFFSDSSPLSLLYPILIKMDKKESLSEKEYKWLWKNDLRELYRTAARKEALSHEGIFQQYSQTLWIARRVAKYWKMAGEPRKVIEYTVVIESLLHPQAGKSDVFTMRGAAFRALGELDKAEACGLEAVKQESNKPTHYPHRLLMAIYFQKGKRDLAIEHLERAIELGAQESDLKDELESLEAEDRREIAKFLINRDREKNRWAEKDLE